MSNAPERARAPSIRDVARLAGVSHQTVSRVLNDHPSIRPETKKRVQDAIAVLDYKPNLAARTLVTSRSRTIGILSATIGEFGPTSSIASIEDAARVEGYSVTTVNLPATTPEAIGDAIRQLGREQVSGIVVLAPRCECSTCCAAWPSACHSSASRPRRARTGSRSRPTRSPAPARSQST